ncbi:MAG: alpha/beta fold hydrolase, partial [Chitinophagaceae bacterium]|nr:alpha/beta fold hydrolase [Anaerolineae bacterium]
MPFLIIAIAFLVLLFIIHQAAQATAQKIKANADPYPLELLQKPISGDEVIIQREDGTKIRAISAGSGPTVILAHGYGYSLSEWNIVWTMLISVGYQVIAFDQRGHGQSTIGRDGIGSKQMAEDYKAVLAHFDVRDAIFVGHSMGSFLMLIFMLSYPEIVTQRLKGAVIFAGTAGNVVKGSTQNRLQIPLIKLGIIERVAKSGVYGWLFGASLYGDQPSPAGIQAFLEIFNEQPHQKLIPILEALANEDYYARLGEISLPCVVICGEKDKTTPRWHSERMAAEIPGARNIW